MILGLEDIPGGSTAISFLVWLGYTLLFYLVCYVAALNVMDDLTKNSWVKIPAMWALAVVSAGLMSILHYNPLVLVVIMVVANYSRVQKQISSDSKNLKYVTLADWKNYRREEVDKIAQNICELVSLVI